MRFTAATIVAFASAVLAQTAYFDVITQPTEGSVVPAGETYTIVWSPTADYNNDTITLTLLGGATSTTLQQVSVLTAGIASSAGKFEWAVSSSLGADATYGIEITLDSDPSILQYSFPFAISAAKAGSSPSSSVHDTKSSSAASSVATTSMSTKTAVSSSLPTQATSSTPSVTSAPSSSALSPSAPSAPSSLSSASSSWSAPSTLATVVTYPTGNVTVVKPSASPSNSSTLSPIAIVTTNSAMSLGAGSFITLVGGLAVAFFAL